MHTTTSAAAIRDAGHIFHLRISGALPISIQNMPEEETGAVYGSGDGSFNLVNYSKESTGGAVSGLNGLSSSIYISRNLGYAFAASENSRVLTVVNRNNGGSYPLSLPGIYRVSVNAGGTFAIAFVQNSDYAYYPLQLTGAQTIQLFRRPEHLAAWRGGL